VRRRSPWFRNLRHSERSEVYLTCCRVDGRVGRRKDATAADAMLRMTPGRALRCMARDTRWTPVRTAPGISVFWKALSLVAMKMSRLHGEYHRLPRQRH
jgi:hypothetical protein